jgi:hypothetical protein
MIDQVFWQYAAVLTDRPDITPDLGESVRGAEFK